MFYDQLTEWEAKAKERDYIVTESEDLPGFMVATDEEGNLYGMFDKSAEFGSLHDSLAEFHEAMVSANALLEAL